MQRSTDLLDVTQFVTYYSRCARVLPRSLLDKIIASRGRINDGDVKQFFSIMRLEWGPRNIAKYNFWLTCLLKSLRNSEVIYDYIPEVKRLLESQDERLSLELLLSSMTDALGTLQGAVEHKEPESDETIEDLEEEAMKNGLDEYGNEIEEQKTD